MPNFTDSSAIMARHDTLHEKLGMETGKYRVGLVASMAHAEISSLLAELSSLEHSFGQAYSAETGRCGHPDVPAPSGPGSPHRVPARRARQAVNAWRASQVE